MNNRMRLKTYDNRKKMMVVAGEYDQNLQIFRKVVERKSHFMRIFSGYGIQEDVLERLKNLECRYVRLREERKGQEPRFYVSHLMDWFTEGHRWNFGHGWQRFLSVKKMKELYVE